MIISIDIGKNPTTILDKDSLYTNNRGGRVSPEKNNNKNIYRNPTGNIILNDEKLKAFPLRPGTKLVYSLSWFLSNILLEILANANACKYMYILTYIYGEGNGNPLQYSCLENLMGRGTRWAAVHGVGKSRTRLSDFTFTFHFHALEKEMAAHSRALDGKSQGRQSLVGCHLWGCIESDTTEAT